MKTKEDIPWKLLEKYFSRIASSREALQVIKWKKEYNENSIIFDQLENYFKETESLPIDFQPKTSIAFEKVSSKIGIGSEPIQKFKILPVLLQIAAVLLIFFGIALLFNQYKRKQAENIFVAQFTSDSIKKEITLPDSSHVWLNSGSTIKYPQKFGSTREVFLTGEAYFEIAHNAEHPFIVRAGKTQTKVLGTKFNLKLNKRDSKVILTLIEGKTSFSVANNDELILTPGKQAVFDNKIQKLSMTETNNPNFLSWKTNEFYFDNIKLNEVFKTLADVYHFKYKFESEHAKNLKLTAKFNKRPLDEIVKTIAISSNLSVTLQNGVYIIQ